MMAENKQIPDESMTAMKKPLVTFKLQKNVSKVQTALQASVKRAFVDLKQITSEETKTKLFKPTEEANASPINEQIEDTEMLKCSYSEPLWSGVPEDMYKIEILKCGVILNTLHLNKKYHTVGRSSACDIALINDTVSQFHAVLQYRKTSDSENEKGLYIYDANSDHGTFLNGQKIKPCTYIFLHSGCMLSFGNSEQKFILQTPKDNEEREAELSAADLQSLKESELEEEEKLENERSFKEKEESLKRGNELKGISWGIAEDENVISESSDDNSMSTNEDLYVSDPKKALMDWFTWNYEGCDLEYETEDIGGGKYACWIDLTLDARGTTQTIGVNITGDKAKAIDACALKACRFLDRVGLLREAYEQKKSTVKNWEEVDYYESDEDNFLDRTGNIEKKRHQRMKVSGKFNAQIETHNSLTEKHAEIKKRIQNLEKMIAVQSSQETVEEETSQDALDVFMSNLNASTLNKTEIKNMKIVLNNLHQEEALIRNSININQSVHPDLL